jgi:hypothetical protein
MIPGNGRERNRHVFGPLLAALRGDDDDVVYVLDGFVLRVRRLFAEAEQAEAERRQHGGAAAFQMKSTHCAATVIGPPVGGGIPQDSELVPPA